MFLLLAAACGCLCIRVATRSQSTTFASLANGAPYVTQKFATVCMLAPIDFGVMNKL
jgi:hypothetical protein